jgi:hypothetical protein
MKTWTPATILDLVQSNPRALTRAIIVLHEAQTADEQAEKATKHRNGRGFDAADAAVGTEMALWVKKTGRTIEGNWRITARLLVEKYAGQLAALANAKEAGKISG